MVRAAPDREQVRATRISLVTAACVTVGVIAVWWYMQSAPRPLAPQRRLTDVKVQWVCEDVPAHNRWALGGYEPVPCPRCSGRALQYIRYEYYCPKHELTFNALVKYDPQSDKQNDDGLRRAERIIAFQHEVPGATWTACDNRVACPVEGCTARVSLTRRRWKAGNSGKSPSP